ncbi:hypothetical protein HDE_11163 [Halotydeus destructor]|nr:hypothetical protein HDE_11163 [Halotydeus destructor]
MCLTLASLISDYKTRALTVKDIYDATPEVESFIHECTVRRHNSYEFLPSQNGSGCERLFDITKYVKQRYVCYSFDLKVTKLDFVVHHVTNGLHAPRFYKIKLKSNFDGAAYFFLHVTNNQLRDHGRRESFTEQFRSLNESGYGDHNYVCLTYKSFHIHKLPPPYRTNCRDYSRDPNFESSDQCYEQCLRAHVVRQLGRLPFSIAIYDEPELQLITDENLNNQTISKTIDGAEKFCTRKCASASCDAFEYTPVIISSEGQDRPFLDFYITNEPETIVESVAQQSTIDVTVYVLSSVGFWFGFSPFVAMMDVKKRIKSKWLTRKSKNYKTESEHNWTRFYKMEIYIHSTQRGVSLS